MPNCQVSNIDKFRLRQRQRLKDKKMIYEVMKENCKLTLKKIERKY